jgi:citrate lyase subunit beta/citryl-CoA lyase
VRRLRSLFFAPANDARKARKFSGLDIDCGVLDLEDAVAIGAKAEAREGLPALLAELVGRVPIAVRVNALGSPFVAADLEVAVAGGVEAIVVPKVDSAADVASLARQLSEFERAGGREDGSVALLPLLETARGVLAAPAIAAASPRILTLVLGTADLAAVLGLAAAGDGAGLAWARSQVVLAASAAGLLEPVDGPYLAIRDQPGLEADCRASRSLGLGGRVTIHPAQVATVNTVYEDRGALTVAVAEKIVREFEEAEARGIAAIDVDGTFVDYPVYARAREVLAPRNADERVA